MNTYVKNSKLHGKGLYTSKNIKKGDIVGKFKGKKTKKDGIHVLWINEFEGILVDNEMKYANHDFINPNCKINERDELIALRDLDVDEEVLWDYSVGHKYSNYNCVNPLFDNLGYSVIHHAIMDGDLNKFKKTLNYLLKNNLYNKVNNSKYYFDKDFKVKYNIIHWVAAYGSKEMFKYMLYKLGKEIFNEKTSLNSNLLHVACYFNNIEILTYIFYNVTEKKYVKYFREYDDLGAYPVDYIIQNDNKKLLSEIIKSKVIRTAFKVSNELYDNYYLFDYCIDKKDIKMIEKINQYDNEAFIYGLLRTDGRIFNKIKDSLNIKLKGSREWFDDYYHKEGSHWKGKRLSRLDYIYNVCLN